MKYGRHQNVCPGPGDIVWLTFTPHAGHEQAGRRPALAISPAAYNKKTGLAIFCPVTNQSKGYPFEVLIPKGLKTTGVILTDQIKSLDWKVRNIEFICRLPDEVTAMALKKLNTLLS